MPKITEEKLRAKVEAGAVGERQLRAALAAKRNSAEVVTMPTLGAISHELNAREATAKAQLDAHAEDAAHNIPLLERIMTERGWDTTTYVCRECGKHRPTPTCSMCEMPEEY